MANQTQKEDMLKKLAQDGKLDQEALERELKQLKQDNEKLKDLQKLADKMNQCQNCMKSGDMAGAQKALGEAAEQLAQTSREQGELDDIREQLESLRDAKDALASALEELERPGGEGGEGNNPGRGDGKGRSDFSQNKGGVGSGRRPEGEQGKIRSYDSRLNGKFDAKGKKVFDGFVPGQAFKKKSSMDIAGDIKQAAQEAPEAIENQRIPKAARDMAKGYFKNLGGQAEGEKDKAKTGDGDKGKAGEGSKQ